MAPEIRSHNDYSVGWICALPKEQTAATAMLDERHPDLPKPMSDTNTYTLGSIGLHNVVITCLPKGQKGESPATNVATLMIRSFPSIKIGLMVGIGGGVPSKVRLGDVVVSTPVGNWPGVVQWDLGEETGGGKFKRTGALNAPPNYLLTALTKLQSEHELTGSRIPSLLEELKVKYPRLAGKYLKSDSLQDLLFRADYAHIREPFMTTQWPTREIVEPSQEEDTGSEEEYGEPCPFCDKNMIFDKDRERRSMRVHYGLIASGNRVIKDGIFRDQLNGSLGGNVLCFEMESAGLMNSFPCLVIRGICDYCDSHRNAAWQGHAAAVAAAFAKELLSCIQPSDVKGGQPIRDVISEVKQGIQRVIDVIAETKNCLDTLRDDTEAKRQTDTLNWISALDFHATQNDYLEKCASDTGQEFLQSEEVQNWMSASKQTMFCQGVPGAGKTFQMAILVNYLVDKFRDDGTVGVAYLYYNFKKQKDQKAEQMFANLVKQLAQISKPFPNAVHQLRDRHDSTKTRPFLGELSNILISLIQSFSKIFILIDALDEGNDHERAKFLDQIFTVQRKTGLKLFATSRAVNTIADKFKGSISRAIAPTRHDIFQLLNSRMSELPDCVRNNKTLQNEIKEAVESAIGGMFLLARLYIDSLAGKQAPAAIRVALKNIHRASTLEDRSEVLNAAYDKSMIRIQQLKGDLPRNALLTISWIVKAKRQLKLTELQEALAVEVGASKLNTDNIPTIEHITQACASLVIVEGDTVELVHYTAQEYFESSGKKWIRKAHADITKICMTYLSFSAFRDEPCFSQKEFNKRIEKSPLYSYSAEFWSYHTNKALKKRSKSSRIDILKVVKFLKSGQAHSSWYRDLLYGYSQKSFCPEFTPTKLTPLHVAAFFGIQNVFSKLISQGNDPNAKDSLSRMPIWWAAWGGHVTAVQLLLKCTTDLETRDLEYGSNPLLIAARRGHETVAELLLDKYDIESKDSSGWTSLNVAIQLGNKAVFDLLTGKDANIETKDNNYQTPLAIAAKDGHMNAVGWLLEKEADIEAKDSKNRTPLMLATIGKHEDLVRIFIEKGAEVEVMDDEYQTPLSIAIQGNLDGIVDLFIGDRINTNMGNEYMPLTLAINKGNDGIAKWLIEKGADLDRIDGRKMTPLLTAIERGNKDTVELLVEKGAGLEIRGYPHGSTPLILASKTNRRDIVELLIQKGADLEAQANFLDETALLPAARAGFTDIVQLLIDKGANIEVKDNYGDTSLSEAARLGLPTIIKLLIDKNSELETKNNKGLTPLSQAAKSGRLEAIHLFIANNANIEAKDNGGLTPLGQAAQAGKSGAIELLLVNKANIEARGNDGFTPLSRAARDGQLDIIKLLLANNANIEARDNNGFTPLGLAVEYGRSKAVELLLINRANIEARDNKGRTPLSHAARDGQLDLIKLLLAKNANIEARDNNGFTPLGLAVEYRRPKVVELLLTNNASTEARDNRGRTPLITAVKSRSWSFLFSDGHRRRLDTCVQLLLDANADMEVKDELGFTPLACTIRNRLNSTTKLLLNSKAGTNYRDASGNTLMHIAVMEGNLDSIHILLGLAAASVDEKDNQGRTPLSRAAGSGKGAVVKALLDSGKANANTEDNQGRTPLLYAVLFKHESVVKELLNSGKVDVNSYSGKGRTPLLFAIGYGDASIVKALLDSESTDVNAKDEKGRTPLRYTVQRKNESVVKMLLNCEKVDVNAADDRGCTPLLYALKHGDISITKMLLCSGKADIEKKDNNGYTAFLYAVKCEDESLIQLLFKEAKINVNTKDKRGRTPLSRATELSDTPIVKALLGYKNVDVEAKDNKGRTPLSYALSCDVGRALLDTRKVNVNSRDDLGRTPLWYATQAGNYQLVELLVRRGAHDGSRPRKIRRWVGNGVRLVVTYSGGLSLWRKIRASPVITVFPSFVFYFLSWSSLR